MPKPESVTTGHPRSEGENAMTQTKPDSQQNCLSELEKAVRIANATLSEPYIDPDDDFCILARQFLRVKEKEEMSNSQPENLLKARKDALEEKLNDQRLMEALADIEHERWSSWMRWMFDNWTEENIARWKRQMVTPYADLPEHSKESDRREVRKTLRAILDMKEKTPCHR